MVCDVGFFRRTIRHLKEVIAFCHPRAKARFHMDFQAVPPPSNYGAPNVFQQPAQQPAAPAQGQQQSQITAALAKAKQLLSSGQMSPDQYTSLTQQLSTMGGNMGAGMPGAQPGAPMNISPPGAMAPVAGG
jgi:hypothetical protein